MAVLKKRPVVVLADAEFEWGTAGDTAYDVPTALAAGGGVIATDNDSLLFHLRSLPVDPFGTPLLIDDTPIATGYTEDDFATRFADRSNRRRM